MEGYMVVRLDRGSIRPHPGEQVSLTAFVPDRMGGYQMHALQMATGNWKQLQAVLGKTAEEFHLVIKLVVDDTDERRLAASVPHAGHWVDLEVQGSVRPVFMAGRDLDYLPASLVMDVPPQVRSAYITSMDLGETAQSAGRCR